ncbi:MAG TPA: ABC-type transport auxiliary lipoprotein family protein [Nevskiaceae bacterium]
MKIKPFTRLSPALLVAGPALLLCACSILPRQPPVQLWQPPQGPIASPTQVGDFSLRVETPSASGLVGDRGILVTQPSGEVSVYAGARWSEAPELFVRHRLVDAFLAAHLPAVTTEDDSLFTNYTLEGDLRAFQTEYRDGAPVVVVRYEAQLHRSGRHVPLATRSFRVDERPTGAEVPQIVAAFGRADDRLAQEVVAWTIATVHAQPDLPATPGRRLLGR